MAKKFFKCAKNSLLYFDLFGHEVNFYINKKGKVKSRFSGIISIAIIVFIAFSFIQSLLNWFRSENVTVISSFEVSSLSDFLSNNRTETYNFDYTNYFINYAPTVEFHNGTIIDMENLTRYVSQSAIYTTYLGDFLPLELERCSKNKYDKFLSPEENIVISNDTILDYAWCIKNNSLLMGKFPRPEINSVYSPVITYNLMKCENSTNNNFSCATDEEINEIMNYFYFEIKVPKTFYDFKKTQYPRKRSYELPWITLDLELTKIYTSELIPVYLYTDNGFFLPDYHLKSIDFNPETHEINLGFPKNNGNLLYSHSVALGNNKQIYYMKNEKILTIISNLGGIINILMIIGKLICFSYNLFILKHKLIKHSFSNLEIDKVKRHEI